MPFCCQLSCQWDQSVGAFLLAIVRSVRSVCGWLLLSSAFLFFMKMVHLFPRRWTARIIWLISVRLSLGNHIPSWRVDLVFAVFLCSQTVVWLQMLGIFKVHVEVDACNWHYCTQGLVPPACTESWLWEGNLLLHCGVEPTLTELRTQTFFVVNGQVAEITFNFWYRLSEELYQRNNQVLTQVFRPYVQRLIIALCRHCQLDSDHVSVVCTRVCVFCGGLGGGKRLF